MNQAKIALLNGMRRAQKGRYPNGIVRQRPRVPRSRFDGLGQIKAPAQDFNVIAEGASSLFNPERALHTQTVKISIKNNHATEIANLVLSAGDHEALYAAQLLKDGANDTTNNGAATVNVTGTSDFGIDAARATIDHFQRLVQNKGALVTNIRIRHGNTSQVGYKLKFQRYNYFGDDQIDLVDPEVYYNPNQYNDKVIDIPMKSVWDKDTIVHYSVLAQETVTLSITIAAVQDLTEILRDYAKRSPGATLL